MSTALYESSRFALRHPRAVGPVLQLRSLILLRKMALWIAFALLLLMAFDMAYGLVEPIYGAQPVPNTSPMTLLCALLASVATALKGPLRAPSALRLIIWGMVVLLVGAGRFLATPIDLAGFDLSQTGVGNGAALGLLLLAAGQLLRRYASGLAALLTTSALFGPLVAMNGYILGQQVLFGEMSLLTAALIAALVTANAIGFARRPVMRLIAADTRSARLVRVHVVLWAALATLMPVLLRAMEIDPGGSFALVYSAQMLALLFGIQYFGLRFSNMLDTARRAERRLLRHVDTDHLTGAATRRAGLAYFMENGWRHSVGVILIDLDHFKAINDAYGHGMGDNVLKFTASVLRQVVRSKDLVVRWGGEEFLVLCRVETNAELRLVSEQVRAHLQNLSQRDDSLPDVTASFGAVLARPDLEPDLEKWLLKADEALYSAKAEGRNRVVLATGLIELPTRVQSA